MYENTLREKQKNNYTARLRTELQAMKDKSSFKLYLTGKVAVQKSYGMLKLKDQQAL